jgi:SAM-dependent methyltransferase
MAVGYNKLCELEDFGDEMLRRYMREVFARQASLVPSFPDGGEARKTWEVAQTARAFMDLGALHERAEILGVAAGKEATIFWATNHARRVFATDLYLDAGGWEGDAPRSMLTAPGKYASCPWNERRLIVQHMNALELLYEDACFDGVFCSSSIEHFGDEENVRQALAEIWRVLKPGGIASLSTEFRLRGPGPGLPGTLLFDATDLDEIIIRPLRWDLVEPLDLTISERTLATALNLADVVAGKAREFPHIVLGEQGNLFTSVHLALRKSDDRASRRG